MNKRKWENRYNTRMKDLEHRKKHTVFWVTVIIVLVASLFFGLMYEPEQGMTGFGISDEGKAPSFLGFGILALTLMVLVVGLVVYTKRKSRKKKTKSKPKKKSRKKKR
ncbi:hypothetical protein CO154_01995 [Candidatus Pacearchaeota archaeon CG_4_9_14_3_um_filter_31_7]|nr:MAG: hypothetical protein CO154_01995 [Candidatus Pacearchaeota archaeon CG_4_9_14_3_um_filter_31_7]